MASAIGILLRRLLARLRRSRLERDLDEEIRQHIERRTRALIDAGVDPREAAFEARRSFGNPTTVRESVRDLWSFAVVESILADVGFGLRIFRHHRLFAVIALASVAAAVAASTGIFMVMNAATLRPLPGAENGRVHRIYTSSHAGSRLNNSSFADFRSITGLRDVFSAACAVKPLHLNLELNAAPRPYRGQVADPACFRLLRITPAMGRFYQDHEATASVVIGYRMWERDLERDAMVTGRAIRINGVDASIVGVAPRGFTGTSLDGGADFWVAPSVAATVQPGVDLNDRRDRSFVVYARLAEGVPEEQAAAALAVLASQLRDAHPAEWTDASSRPRVFTIMEERRSRFASSPGGVYLLLGSAAGIIVTVIAIACMNLATMLLAIGVSRTREISVRLALGASHGRVLRQLVTECLSIGLLGSALGLFVVSALREVALTRLPTEAPALDLAIDWRVITVACGLGVLTPLLFGLAPALHSVRLAIAQGIKAPSEPVRLGRIAFGSREALIVLQVATSCAMLLIASLFAVALLDMRTTSPGFRTSGIATAELDLTLTGSTDRMRMAMRRLVEQATSAEDVDRVAIAGVVPLTGSAIHFLVRPDSEATGAERLFDANIVGPGYFDLLGIPLRLGRDFDGGDSAASSRVVIVNTALAQALWRTDGAVGRTMSLGEGRTAQVVGVVADTRYRTLSGDAEPLLFVPYEQHVPRRMVIHARIRGNGAVASLERNLRAADARVMVGRVGTLEGWLEDARIVERAFQWGGAAAGVFQFALAIMGLWALVAYTVQRRTRELGVRLALGATPAGLVALTLRPCLAMIVGGVVLGTAAGLAGGSLLRASASGVAAVEPVLAVPVGTVLILAASLAAWLPARAVAAADPAAALRHE